MSHLIQHDGNFVSYGHVQGKTANNCALVCGYLEKKSTDMYVQSIIEKMLVAVCWLFSLA